MHVPAPFFEASEVRSASERQASMLLAYGLAAAAILATMISLQYRYPVAYVYAIHEDGVVENSTAIAFALAAFLLMLECRRSTHPLRLGLLIAAATFAFLLAGEEISWGQRILGIDPPETVRAVNSQGELNLHNLEGVRGLPKYRPLAVVLLIGLAVSVALSPVQSRAGVTAIVRALPLLQPALAPLILLTAWVLLFLPFVRSDEWGEFLLGLSLLAWAVNLALDGRTGSSGLVPAAGLGVLAAVVLVGSSLAATFPPEDPGLRLNLTARAFAQYGLYEQAERIFEHILAHPQYVEPKSLESYEAVRRRTTP